MKQDSVHQEVFGTELRNRRMSQVKVHEVNGTEFVQVLNKIECNAAK